ncbi:MAG: NAD(P)/FAD-dependent oxidoreductase [Eubacteriales bacterium]
MSKKRRVVIVGNGIAGNEAAVALRKVDKGANIFIISDEKYNLYSACVLSDYLADEIPRNRVFLRNYRFNTGITKILGQLVIGVNLDAKELYLEEGKLSYDSLILATGSRPILPRIKGINIPGVFTLKTIHDADRISNFLLRKKSSTIVVVGSGPVGIEVSIALYKKGCKVVIVELMPWILAKVFDREAGERIKSYLLDHGIIVLTGEQITAIYGQDSVEYVETTERRITCDAVVMCIGMQPNVDLAQKIGVRMGDFGGILVNDRMCTSIPDVYACGDCVTAMSAIDGRPVLSLLWHNAVQQGRIAGTNCAGIRARYKGSLNMMGLHVFGLYIVSIGETLGTVGNQSTQVTDINHETRFKRIISLEDRIIGGQFIGYGSGIGTIVAAIKKHDYYGIESLSAKRDFPSKSQPWNAAIVRVLD